MTRNSFSNHFWVKKKHEWINFWQKSKNPVLRKILGIFRETRIFLLKNKNKLALSVFDPYDSLASCKISKKIQKSFLRKTDN